MAKHPEFLYPTARRYPFDEICEQMVRELEIRNWEANCIIAKNCIHAHGSNPGWTPGDYSEGYEAIGEITGPYPYFNLVFGSRREQLAQSSGNAQEAAPLMGAWVITTDEMELQVFGEKYNEPPRLCLPIRKDPLAVKRFRDTYKIRDKTVSDVYVQYRGDAPQEQAQNFLHIKSEGQGVPPDGTPTSVSVAEVFEYFCKFLAERLQEIRSTPLDRIWEDMGLVSDPWRHKFCCRYVDYTKVYAPNPAWMVVGRGNSVTTPKHALVRPDLIIRSDGTAVFLNLPMREDSQRIAAEYLADVNKNGNPPLSVWDSLVEKLTLSD